MALSTQSNFDKITGPDAHACGIDGGLNLKSDKSRLASPSTTRADNASYFSPGTVQQLPAFSSSMPAGVRHIYNLHARDTYAPSVTGDVMLHGESIDAGAATTSPVWTHAQGAAKNTAQPIPPFSLRTRLIGNKLQQTYSNTANGYWAGNGFADIINPMIVRQEGATAATRRFALATGDQASNVTLVFGLCDGMQETGESLTLTLAGTVVWYELVAILGTPNFALIYQVGANVYRTILDFYGNVVSGRALMTGAALPPSTSGRTCQPTTTFHHQGVTYLAVIGNASPYQAFAYPIAGAPAGGFISLGSALSSAGAIPTGAFAVCSPDTHQTTSGRNYLCVAYNGRVFVITNPFGGGTSYVSPGSFLSTPQANPTAGLWNSLATMSCASTDGGSVNSLTAALTVTVFSHMAEYVSQTNTVNQTYQTVAVDVVNFVGQPTAAATFGASGSSNVFRAPGGVALAAKAFSSCPPEAQFAGATRAVNAYCAVRIGAGEPNPFRQEPLPAASYGQPTYFLLDHMARPVGRWLESSAPIGSSYTAYGVTATNTTASTANFPLPYALSAPLISDGTPTDVSCLDVQVPGWAQTFLLNPAGPPNYPLQVTHTPALAHFSMSSSASHVPAVQSGPYTVCSGPLTCIHDGRAMTEANYHTAAFNVSVGAPSTPAPNALGAAATYSYTSIWLWTDNNGRLHRSAPSAVQTFTPSAQFFGASVICTPPVTNKVPFGQSYSGIGSNITVKLYRSSPASPGVFFEVGSQYISQSFGAYGTASNYGVRFLDNSLYDGSIIGQAKNSYADQQAPLYVVLDKTTNQPTVPASAPPPAFLWQTSTKGRVFGLAQVLGQFRIYYSSFITSGLPYEWNGGNYVAVPPDLGDVRSIETIDDKVFVLGTRINAVFSGDGPDNGIVAPPGAGFSLITPVPTPSGIIGTGSPARVPGGIVFQGGQGIQQIGRDGTISPIGAQVEPITGRQVNNPGVVLGRATVLPSLQAVVWANPQGPALVYNYLAQKWSTWPLLSGCSVLAQRMDNAAAAALQPITAGKLAATASAGNAGADYGLLGAAYNPIYQGFASSATLVLETPWILPSDESGGEGVLWDVMVTGDWLGPHVLQVEQAYNYATAYNAPSQCQWPSAPQQYAYRVRPLRSSRVWAVRYRVSLLPLTTLQAGYPMANINDLVVNYGARQGTTRTGAAQSG